MGQLQDRARAKYQQAVADTKAASLAQAAAAAERYREDMVRVLRGALILGGDQEPSWTSPILGMQACLIDGLVFLWRPYQYAGDIISSPSVLLAQACKLCGEFKTAEVASLYQLGQHLEVIAAGEWMHPSSYQCDQPRDEDDEQPLAPTPPALSLTADEQALVGAIRSLLGEAIDGHLVNYHEGQV